MVRYVYITCPLCKLSHLYRYGQVVIADTQELFCPNTDKYFLIPEDYYGRIIKKMMEAFDNNYNGPPQIPDKPQRKRATVYNPDGTVLGKPYVDELKADPNAVITALKGGQ